MVKETIEAISGKRGVQNSDAITKTYSHIVVQLVESENIRHVEVYKDIFDVKISWEDKRGEQLNLECIKQCSTFIYFGEST